MLSPLSAVKIQIDPNPLFPKREREKREGTGRKEGRKRLLLLSKIVIVMRSPLPSSVPPFLPFPFWFSAR